MILKPSIAVIIVTWNSAKFISSVLSCLKLQTYQPAKIIILDNASDDLADLQKVLAAESFSVDFIALPKNVGFAAANNVGINRCDTIDLIALLNPDAFPEPAWLENLVNATQIYPEYSFFSSRQMQLGGELLDGAGDGMYFWGKPFRRGYGKTIKAQYLIDKPVFSACAAAAIYRANALTEVGGFDEDFFCYMEDVDLSFRLQLRGHSCMYVANAVVIHIGSASLGKRSDFSLFYGQRNMVICFFKNMPLVMLIIFMPVHLLINIFYLLSAIFIGKFFVLLRAKFEAISLIKRFYSKRKMVQENKKISPIKLLFLLSFLFK
jgi:GT2 family glycosyltransferase